MSDPGSPLAGDANGFVLCTAWLVECLALAGEPEAAVALCDRLLAGGNDVGLFAEQIEPGGGYAGLHAGVLTRRRHQGRWRMKSALQPRGDLCV